MARIKADKQRKLGVSMKDQLKQIKEYEYVTQARTVAHHNTVCNSKCHIVCHENCKLPFTQDGAALLACTINSNGNCHKCGCPTVSHTHATIEYYKEKQ